MKTTKSIKFTLLDIVSVNYLMIYISIIIFLIKGAFFFMDEVIVLIILIPDYKLILRENNVQKLALKRGDMIKFH